jgi:NADPH-dependent 2,4-dienoyl-CoA reductase/sulfur reductase-like enzyme
LSGSGIRLSAVVPDPNKLYRPFIWILNGPAPAAGSSIVLTIWRMLSMDIQEMQAEIGGGRGNSTAAQSLPVTIAGGAVTIGNATASASNSGGVFAIGVSTATTNIRSIKASAGKIVGGHLANFSAAWKFLKIYNKATAPVPGTDVPVYTIPIPPNSKVQIGAIFDQYGIYLSAGIGIAITNLVADLDATAVGAGDVQYGLIYA